MKRDGLHYLIKLVNEWREKYHADHKGTVTFQNKELMSNVRFTNGSMHAIQNHSRGVELLPETIENPDEVWSWWEDAKKQRVTMRSYIAGDYVVLTKDGQITDGFLVRSKDKYRKGCILI